MTTFYKLISKLLIFFFLTINLKASLESLELIQNITTTYYQPFYNKISSSFIFENNKSNPIQKRVQEDLEKILLSYLETKHLFTHSTLTKLKEQNKTLLGLPTFFNLSFKYAKYLQENNQEELALQIVEQNLINLYDLMTNAPTIIDYVIGLGSYNNFFKSYSHPSKEIVALLKKYPPPPPSLYFQKLELEKKELFKRLDSLSKINQDIIDSSQKEAYEKLMKKIKAFAKFYLEEYFSKMRLAASSKKEQIELKNYLKKEREELFSTSTKIKMALHNTLAKLFYFFVGYNSQFDYIAKYIGKMLALISVPPIDNLYKKHLEMLQEYYNFLEKAK